jgi:hypothetical protein
MANKETVEKAKASVFLAKADSLMNMKRADLADKAVDIKTTRIELLEAEKQEKSDQHQMRFQQAKDRVAEATSQGKIKIHTLEGENKDYRARINELEARVLDTNNLLISFKQRRQKMRQIERRRWRKPVGWRLLTRLKMQKRLQSVKNFERNWM